MKRGTWESVKAAILKTREMADDETALFSMSIYPAWKPGVSYPLGARVRYRGHLYRVRQQHIAAEGWEPDIAPALFEVIALPTEAGTQDCPIAYTVGMTLEEGKYYAEDGAVYRCIRDTGVPVYYPLTKLIGLYVEVL